MKNCKLIFFLLLGIIFMSTSLTACRSNEQNRITQTSMTKDNAKIILEGIENRTYESTAELFSSYVKDNYPDLTQDIAALMEYIDGEVISYEAITSNSQGGHSTPEGWVEKRYEGVIHNVKTNANRTYNIKFGGYYIYKDKPEKVGVAYIIIESLDDVDEKGYHIAKSIYYE